MTCTLACGTGIAVAVAGCSSDSSHREPPSASRTGSSGATITSTSSASHPRSSGEPTLPGDPSGSSDTPSSAVSLARSKAVSAYLGMWSDFAAAGHTSNWRSPLLSQHATAYALQVMEKSLYTDHKNGVITKGAPVDHPTVTSVSPANDPTIVVVSDCGDSSHTRKYNAASGKPPPGGAGGRQKITAEVRRQADGSWKVDQFAVEGVGSC